MRTSSPEPGWMHGVVPNTLDRRVLAQDRWWVTADGRILELVHLSSGHLRNIVAMLRGCAVLLHLEAMLDVLLGEPGELMAEIAIHHLTGSSVATVSPQDWIESTQLMRALRKELADREASDAVGR